MFKRLRRLAVMQETTKQKIRDGIYNKFPLITSVNIYNNRNLSIESDMFTADIYQSSDPKEVIKMSCNSQMTDIPTDEEALAKVQAMRDAKEAFTEAVEYVISMLKEE